MAGERSTDRIEIQPLVVLRPEDIRRLNVGYSSPGYYRVDKVESSSRTTFTLELVTIDQPVHKRWETDDDELAMLQQAVTGGLSWAAYSDGEMVGIAICEARLWNRSLWIWDFHVAPGYQRSGIGTRLMHNVLQSAGRASLRVAALEVQSSNLPAIQFYRHCGFEIDGVDLSLYTNDDVERNEVALYMKKKM